MSIQITIDGVAKTLDGAVTTGKALHALAGDSIALQSGGVDVPNNDVAYTVTANQAFTTKPAKKK